jgi:hypothetical protein
MVLGELVVWQDPPINVDRILSVMNGASIDRGESLHNMIMRLKSIAKSSEHPHHRVEE